MSKKRARDALADCRAPTDQDIKLLVGEPPEEIPAHSQILAMCSEFFRATLSGSAPSCESFETPPRSTTMSSTCLPQSRQSTKAAASSSTVGAFDASSARDCGQPATSSASASVIAACDAIGASPSADVHAELASFLQQHRNRRFRGTAYRGATRSEKTQERGSWRRRVAFDALRKLARGGGARLSQSIARP